MTFKTDEIFWEDFLILLKCLEEKIQDINNLKLPCPESDISEKDKILNSATMDE